VTAPLAMESPSPLPLSSACGAFSVPWCSDPARAPAPAFTGVNVVGASAPTSLHGATPPPRGSIPASELEQACWRALFHGCALPGSSTLGGRQAPASSPRHLLDLLWSGLGWALSSNGASAIFHGRQALSSAVARPLCFPWTAQVSADDRCLPYGFSPSDVVHVPAPWPRASEPREQPSSMLELHRHSPSNAPAQNLLCSAL
jgi:hypothetical protein